MYVIFCSSFKLLYLVIFWYIYIFAAICRACNDTVLFIDCILPAVSSSIMPRPCHCYFYIACHILLPPFLCTFLFSCHIEGTFFTHICAMSLFFFYIFYISSIVVNTFVGIFSTYIICMVWHSIIVLFFYSFYLHMDIVIYDMYILCHVVRAPSGDELIPYYSAVLVCIIDDGVVNYRHDGVVTLVTNPVLVMEYDVRDGEDGWRHFENTPHSFAFSFELFWKTLFFSFSFIFYISYTVYVLFCSQRGVAYINIYMPVIVVALYVKHVCAIFMYTCVTSVMEWKEEDYVREGGRKWWAGGDDDVVMKNNEMKRRSSATVLLRNAAQPPWPLLLPVLLLLLAVLCRRGGDISVITTTTHANKKQQPDDICGVVVGGGGVAGMYCASKRKSLLNVWFYVTYLPTYLPTTYTVLICCCCYSTGPIYPVVVLWPIIHL